MHKKKQAEPTRERKDYEYERNERQKNRTYGGAAYDHREKKSRSHQKEKIISKQIMSDSAAVKLTQNLLSFVSFDDQTFYVVERGKIVRHTKTIPHDDIVYDFTCKHRENQTWNCLKRPSLHSFIRRNLTSTNYETTCYLNSCLIALLAFKNTRFHALLSSQDKCDRQNCNQSSSRYLKSLLHLNRPGGKAPKDKVWIGGDRGDWGTQEELNELTAEIMRSDEYNALVEASNDDKDNIIVLFQRIHSDLQNPDSTFKYGEWPYKHAFNALRKCFNLGLHDDDRIGAWGDAASTMNSIMDMVTCGNFDGIQFYPELQPDESFEKFVKSKISSFKHQIALITFDVSPPSVPGDKVRNYEAEEIHRAFIESNPQKAKPSMINVPGYVILSIIVQTVNHYTCFLHDLERQKWRYFDSNGGLQADVYEVPPIQKFVHRWTYYLEKI